MRTKIQSLLKKSTYWIGIVIFGTVLGLTLQFVKAWTEPTQAPPAGNVDAPINVSGIAQAKAGGLILNTGGATNGLLVPNGNVGIGTTSPTQQLDVSGYIKGQTGLCIGNDCRTSWPAGGGGIAGSGTANYIPKFTDATTLGNAIVYDNGTNIGIGTITPSQKLDVTGNIYASGDVCNGAGQCLSNVGGGGGANVTCTDTDGGPNYATAGQVTHCVGSACVTRHDFCEWNDGWGITVDDYYCDINQNLAIYRWVESLDAPWQPWPDIGNHLPRPPYSGCQNGGIQITCWDDSVNPPNGPRACHDIFGNSRSTDGQCQYTNTSYMSYSCEYFPDPYPYCPFMYLWNGQEYVADNTFIYKLNSQEKESVQLREIEHLDLITGVIKAKIVEKEAETSHINQLSLLVVDQQGENKIETELKPTYASRDLDKILEDDNDYLITNLNDEVEVEFGPAPELKDGWQRTAYIKAKGYYQSY